MASSPTEADSRLNQILVPALEKIIKNGSWLKHSKLAHECKSVIERFVSPNKPPSTPGSAPSSPCSQWDSVTSPCLPGVLADFSLANSELFLSPLITALASGNLHIAEPALDAVQKLITQGYLRGEADPTGGPGSRLLAKVIEAVSKCLELGDDHVELLIIKTALSSVTSLSLRIQGDSLLQVVRTCYDLCLESKNVMNQATAKASLIQILVIVFQRMEADSTTIPLRPIAVAELMEPAEKVDGDGTMTMFVQGFITKIMSDVDGMLITSPMSTNADGVAYTMAFDATSSGVELTNPADVLDSTDKDMLDVKYWEINMFKTALEGRKEELMDGDGERDDDFEVKISNQLRRDAFLVFRALCKLSMKTPHKEDMTDPQLIKGKIVALELLKILLENAGTVFRTSERFLGAIKQYLCLSLLKNSSSSLITLFRLLCSIFISLVSRFRAGLKAEIGVFFPMIVLRVLENVSQPNFQQKMIVLLFLEKLCVDCQIFVDIFLNYDCDAQSSNIFERMVNGLLKSAQGAPPGTVMTISPLQEATMKLEAIKCLVAILKSMGDWMNKQLRIPDPHSAKKYETSESDYEPSNPFGNGDRSDAVKTSDSHSEASIELSDASTIEQYHSYKLEFQEGISLFNRKPKEGINFLINENKVGNSVEEIATFLKNTSGLNKTSIGDYLGEKEDLSLKVMHAYVDSFDFHGVEFDEAIRAFLHGFRLPCEALKIDRIMEKFAERYCKCNPKTFSSTDIAYVLAYSVIMLNADAHSPMVKSKMSADDFIRNNHGIDDGKDLPEEYLRSLFERISRNEIKMEDEDSLTVQRRRPVDSNKILGLNSFLDIVAHNRVEENIETCDALIKHMHEQFKENAPTSEPYFYEATDVVILRFMIESCWAPMLAAFSVSLDQSDEEVVIAQCLKGFRYAIHIIAAMSMKMHRDAFVISVAKFTSLHSPADIKQKNIDAIKMNKMVSNLNMFEQVGEMSHIFVRSPKLNSEAIVDFVKALCKVSMDELRPTSNPRIFSLMKMVEIAHYNMDRIRLVWSKIWNVLSDFFVTIGCSENLSIAIFAMDSLRQLSMKFLELGELTNYNFQNEFMKPFVIVMHKSSAIEIRELIIRCVSQMVLSRVNYVKSGWKSMFMVFTTAAYDGHKSTVLLAFEIMEKIVRDCFPYITETERAFTVCVNCLVAFTNSRPDRDINLNAFALLRFCADKLAKGDLDSSKNKDEETSGSISKLQKGNGKTNENGELANKEDHYYLWFPLLAGLSELSLDPSPEIRKNALEVLFDSLRNYGHHFSLPLWERIFESVLFPILNYVQLTINPSGENSLEQGLDGDEGKQDQDVWLYDMCTLTFEVIVDLLVKFYNTVNPLMWKVLTILVSFIKHPHQGLSGIGITSFVRLTSSAGNLFSEDKWFEVVSFIKEAARATLPDFSFILIEDEDNNKLLTEEEILSRNTGESAVTDTPDDDKRNLRLHHLYTSISDVKCRAAVQFLIVQAVVEIYNIYKQQLSAKNVVVLFDAVHTVAFQAHKINSDAILRSKLHELGSMTQMQDPPLLRLENESYKSCLTVLKYHAVDRPPSSEEPEMEAYFVNLCHEVLQFYIEVACSGPLSHSSTRWLVPLGSGKRRELAVRAPLVVSTLQAICSLGESSFRKNLSCFFPLLTSLVSCEHGSNQVQLALSHMFSSSVGPLLLTSH
ncbi:PREDICTED: brefeldin A-inhibited guanine nucleotide-exchange protein 2-like isoform X2 [Ipomoea nil]|uniref:brefeldin A-inhibited guanine nucleotide-exchange protein 2-like isoform X2 n=1 Tax=Ipomoea nil TaxID=35883 RepID=UPI0009011CE2|nr:PREDICTED: brefeldin A-inhibited guanine nucleotide-exchange protein 2-like isoform X2 [Ipomoea nil]